jgi:hypothetical protein
VARSTFVQQIVESLRRIEYLRLIATRPSSAASADPNNAAFDPLKAAILKQRQGEVDEAFWLVFLATHFGRHRQSKWKLCADIYGQLGQGPILTWHRLSANPEAFASWLQNHEHRLRNNPKRHHFGNHRKYETLSASSDRSTARVFASYVSWVGANQGHRLKFEEVAGGCAERHMAFHALYCSLGDVLSFGRTARFDYLTLLGNLGLTTIEPGIPYLEGATGPLRGARLLFGGSTTAPIGQKQLSDDVVALGKHAGLGMQVLEDAMCNWQKSPTVFVPFRG